MDKKKQRNWSEYNQKLKRHARIEVFINIQVLDNWDYDGPRKRGGAIVYRDSVIEMCLLIREYYGLALRQTEGFVGSLLSAMGHNFKAPDYTTLSRRAAKLSVSLQNKSRAINAGAMVLAVDSTGLSVHRRDMWNREKHGRSDGKWQEKWRKLHVCIDVETGHIHSASYTLANVNDGTEMPPLIKDIAAKNIKAVCGDMAYDTINSRKAIYEKKAAQLIPPIRNARLSKDNRNMKRDAEYLQERDNAINYINHNKINGNAKAARKLWKEKVGYHARSLVETTMWQIKTHTGTKLTNRTEENRATQSMIKCKLVNMMIAA